jgi:hypothetical protein
MTRIRILLAAAALALSPVVAFAQSSGPPTQEPTRREDPIRVQVNINSFFPGPTGDTEDAAKLRDRAQRAMYDMAGRECALLEQTLAKTCKLDQVTVNINRQVAVQVGTQEGYTAVGNFIMRATLK